MKNKILDLEIRNSLYTFFLDTKDNKMYVFAYKRKVGGYWVKNLDEIAILNDCINQLNNKYIRLNNIFNENGIEYKRYYNIYNNLYYFSLKDDKSNTLLLRTEILDLFQKYNMPQLCYYQSDNGHSVNGQTQEQIGLNTDDNVQPSGNPYQNDETAKKYSNYNRKFKRIIKLLGTLAATVSITLGGVVQLSDGKLPLVEYTQATTQSVEDTNSNDFSNIDNSENEELEKRFRAIENSMREAEVEPWVIAHKLRWIADEENLSDKIAFSYKDGEIIYSFILKEYNKYRPFKEELKVDLSQDIPPNIQEIVDAVNGNNNLSLEEKEFIISTNLPKWIQYADYIYADILANRYSNLKITYHYEDGGYEIGSNSNSPYIYVAGTTRTDFDNAEITIYNGPNLKKSLRNPNVLTHELIHVDSMSSGKLIYEGMTQLLSKAGNGGSYYYEQLMCLLLMEVFGKNTMIERIL